ncbi:MAG: metallophosphoesterase family protein [Planctomycetota bacterium]
MSDSHGRAETTRKAVSRLMEGGAQVLIHLGDLGTVEVIDALAVDGPGGEQVEAHMVFGNTDWDRVELARYAESLDIRVADPHGDLEWDGARVVFCHGHEAEPMRAAVRDGAAYLCHGHTHRPENTRQSGTRVVNPGALFRASRYTAALLDTAADEVRFVEVPWGPGGGVGHVG